MRGPRHLAALLLLVAAPSLAQNVLVFDASGESNAGIVCFNLAAVDGDIASCQIANNANFNDLMDQGGWNVVILDVESTTPPGEWVAQVEQAVADGACVIASHWFTPEAEAAAPIFEVSIGAIHQPLTLYRWNSDPLFSTPESVPNPLPAVDDDWADNGFYLTPTGGAYAAAGFTVDPTAGQAAIVVGNGGRTIFHGLLFDNYSPSDLEPDTQEDIQELIENEIRSVIAVGCAESVGLPSVLEVPTLSPGGLAAAALALVAAAIVALRRRAA